MSSKEVIDKAELIVLEMVSALAQAGILNPEEQHSILIKQAAIHSMVSTIITTMIDEKKKTIIH